MLKCFWSDEAGATAIEYAVLIALVSLGGLAALSSVGNGLINLFDPSAEELEEIAKRCEIVGSNCGKKK